MMDKVLLDLEQQAEELRKKLYSLWDKAKKRESDLYLGKAVQQLALRGSKKSLFGSEFEYIIGNYICHCKESHHYGSSYGSSYKVWVTRGRDELVFEDDISTGITCFRDGPWADEISEHWRLICVAQQVQQFNDQIAKFTW